MLDLTAALLRRLPPSLLGALVAFPLVVSGYLLGVLTGAVPSPLHRIEAALAVHTREDVERLRLARVTCVNTAHAILDPDRREARIAACWPDPGAP